MPVEKCGVEGNFENMALGGYQAIYEHVHTADTSTSNNTAIHDCLHKYST